MDAANGLRGGGVMASLNDTLTVGAGAGLAGGALLGFARPARNDRELMKNIRLGAELGMIFGTLGAFAYGFAEALFGAG